MHLDVYQATVSIFMHNQYPLTFYRIKSYILFFFVAYHRTLNDAVQVRHPSLWMFLRHLKDQQQLAEEKLEMADRGDAPPNRRRKWRELEARLQRLREQYIAGRRHLASYWKAVTRSISV